MKSYSTDDYLGQNILGVPAAASATEPTSAENGALWLDISTNPPILKYRYNGSWVNIAARNDVVGVTGGVVNGPLRVDSLNVGNIMIEKSFPINYSANIANQKIDLYASNVESLESLVDIFVVTNVGSLSRRFSLTKQGSGIYQSGSRYNEVLGTANLYLAISDVKWDAVNNRWRFQIVNRTPYPLLVRGSINIRLYSTVAQADQLVDTFGITPVYTSDATTLPEPILQFAGNISADSLIASFKTISTSYTANLIDNVIMCTAGLTVTLPDPITLPVGRSYRVKNLQNSSVTVRVTNNKLIDGSTTATVGNAQVLEFMNDGTQYRIMSMYR